MPRRYKVILLLFLLSVGGLALIMVQQNHDRLFPRDACFTREGTDIGDYPLCVEGKQPVVDRSITSDMLDEPYAAPTHRVCQRACQENELCSHYVFRLPPEYYNSNIMVQSPESFSCLLLQQSPG